METIHWWVGLKKIKVLAGKEAEFVKIFNKLKSQIKENELDNEYYDLYQSKNRT